MARFNPLLSRNEFPVRVRWELRHKPLRSLLNFGPMDDVGGLEEHNSLHFPG